MTVGALLLLIWLQLVHYGSAGIFSVVADRPQQFENVTWSTWTNGVIPVIISSNFTRSERQSIMNAFTYLHRRSCIKFVVRKPRHKDYVRLTNNDEIRCYSAVGRIRGEQQLNLKDTCLEQNMVLHQLMHTIGFRDEHNRYDRDLYIAINYTNIEPTHLWRFDILPKEQTVAYNLSYDYLSVMHFGTYYFARNTKYPVLIPKHHTPALGPGAGGLSYKDLIKINKMYECTNTTISH